MRLFGRDGRSRAQAAVSLVDPLTAAEAEWRDRNIEVSRVLVERYRLGTVTELPSLEQLDAILRTWQNDVEPDIDVDAVVHAVGMTFGAHLAATAGLSWVLTADDGGVELGLRAEPEDVLVHPARAVAVFLAARGEVKLQSLHDELAAGVAHRRRPTGDRRSEPRASSTVERPPT